MQIQQIIQYLSDFSGIPATQFVENTEMVHSSALPYLSRMAQNAPFELLDTENSVSCVLTGELLCYGTVQPDDGSGLILFGPVCATECDNARAQRILRKSGLPTTEAGKLMNYLRGTPIFSYQKFCKFILFANYTINGDEADITQLLGDDYSFRDESPAESTVTIDSATTHDAQAYENVLYALISLGQYDKMQAFIKNSSYKGNEGMLATDLLRHQKNLVIASATLASRAAVEGGLDYETSMSLADAYIQKVELAPNMKTLIPLHFNMLKTYTRMVWEHKHNHADGGISVRAHRYIDEHIGEKLSGQTIADALGVSRTYLSSQFKQETGINLNDFINQQKIDEAKLLLITTDLTISQIAEQLCFSSQSHLHTVFKKLTGHTPAEYREAKIERNYPR